jgi:tetratricopeptide (TPR) repeat protein
MASLRDRLGSFVLILAILSPNLGHSADPSLWDAARKPRLARDIAALRNAERAFVQTRSASEKEKLALLHEALRILERADAKNSPDPRVRFLHGRLLSQLDQDEQAIAALRNAIAFAPNHPSVGDALFSLAIALAKQGHSQEEIQVYETWLRIESSSDQRAIGQSNLGESLMAAGRLEEAIQAYQKSIANAPHNALAHWGLAVALDRSGDIDAALQSANTALFYDPDSSLLDGPNVFFSPAYDRYWYHALGAMTRARRLANTQALWWDRAISMWQKYLEIAATEDRWLDMARARLAHCEKERSKTPLRKR